MAGSRRDPLVSVPTRDDVLYLVVNLRQSDREETFDTLVLDPADPVEYLADLVFSAADAALECELYSDPDTGKPFALMFINRASLTSAHFNFLCTPEVERHMGWLTRQALTRIDGTMSWHRLRRIECRARNIRSHVKWLQVLGARLECEVPGFSQHEFAQLAWVNGGSNDVSLQ